MSQALEGHAAIDGGGEELEKALPVLDEATILRCLEVISSRAGQLKDKGLNSWSFFFGVVNVLVVTWFFGVLPEHFWIVYIVETLILFPIRWKHMAHAKPLSEVLYWLDFCWISNFVCNLGLFAFLLDAYYNNDAVDRYLEYLDGSSVRQTLFCTFWGVATGPLLCAVIVLGNALVFHDPDNTVSVFIHLCPSLLAFTLRWHSEAVLKAWPGLFHLDYFDQVNAWVNVYGNAALFYLAWFVLYALWLVFFGMKMPSKGYDTVFHSMMRGANPVASLLGWSKEESAQRAKMNDFTVGSALIYMLFHAVAVLLAMTVSVLCFVSEYFHGGACLLAVLMAIYKGSSRYTYYILENYASVLHREFDGVLKTPVHKQ